MNPTPSGRTPPGDTPSELPSHERRLFESTPPASPPPLPPTEAVHPATSTAPPRTPEEWLPLFDAEEPRVARALAAAGASIAALGAAMADALVRGGRIISFGAGTSGRLATLDAAEWGPTFGIDPSRVIARIAGGPEALTRAVEGAEDEPSPARAEVFALEVDPRDLVIGISASASAAYVRAAVETAASRRTPIAWITAAPPPPLALDLAAVIPPPIHVVLDLGPELIAGSTRLQAATATHRVLQRASVLCAVASGWIHRGRMVEMRPTNEKLRGRAVRIVAELAAVDRDAASDALARAADDVKAAIVVAARGMSADDARAALAAVDRRLDRIDGLPC